MSARTVPQRQVPYDLNAEKGVLGSILIERDAIIVVASWLRGDMFYLKKHQLIYEAALRCHQNRTPPDFTTIYSELRKSENDEGMLAYLGELSSEVPTAVHVEYYARIVESTWQRRELIRVSGEIAASAFDERTETNQTLVQAEEMLHNVTQHQYRKGGYKDTQTTMNACLSLIKQAQTGEGRVKTGFDLDFQGGMFNGDLIIMAARPSVGKTALALNIAKNVAEAGGNVGFVSLEMSADQLGLRLITMLSGVPVKAMRTGQVSDEDIQSIVDSMASISNLPIFIDDMPGQSMADIRSRAWNLHNQVGGLSLLVIDYVGMIRHSERGNPVHELEKIANELKVLSKELGCPVLVLSQLSREVEKRVSHKPQMSDLRGSGGLEQAADHVWLLYREDLYDKETDRQGIVEVLIEKSRQGETGTVVLKFNAAYNLFESYYGAREVEGY